MPKSSTDHNTIKTSKNTYQSSNTATILDSISSVPSAEKHLLQGLLLTKQTSLPAGHIQSQPSINLLSQQIRQPIDQISILKGCEICIRIVS